MQYGRNILAIFNVSTDHYLLRKYPALFQPNIMGGGVAN